MRHFINLSTLKVLVTSSIEPQAKRVVECDAKFRQGKIREVGSEKEVTPPSSVPICSYNFSKKSKNEK